MDSLISYLTTSYANWRIHPTEQERHAYNTTDKVLLTFDDFTDANRLRKILHILKNEKIKAVFFLVGEWSIRYPELVEEIKEAGHWVGNHTKTHANLLKLSDNQIKTEILEGFSSSLLRPPYGKYNKRIRNIAKTLGYKICYWDIDSNDWKGISSSEIKSHVIKNLHPGACILLHLDGSHTLEALPSLIQEIREKGYQLCSDGKELLLP